MLNAGFCPLPEGSVRGFPAGGDSEFIIHN